MARRAHGLDVLVVFCGVATVVVVLVTTLASLMHVSAIGARKLIRVWDQAGVNEIVDSASRLFLIAIARSHKSTARLGTPAWYIGGPGCIVPRLATVTHQAITT